MGLSPDPDDSAFPGMAMLLMGHRMDGFCCKKWYGSVLMLEML